MNVLMMALAKGFETKETVEIKRYIGIGTCSVIGVNPTGKEIEELMGYTPKEEPVYFGSQEVEGKMVPYTRISFVLKTVPEKCNGIDTTIMLTYFVRNQYRVGGTSGKYQVIDAYARTAWGDKEVIQKGGKIMYKEGTMEANISAGYRPAYVGEEGLTNFLKVYLNIPAPAEYVNGSWIDKKGSDLADCECRLDHIAEMFKGNFEEVKNAIALQPNNKVKVLFGVRVNEDGREFQDVYPETVLRANTNKYEKLQKEIEDRQANGGLKNRIYEFTDLHEYTVEPTNFLEESTEGANDPFENAAEAPAW